MKQVLRIAFVSFALIAALAFVAGCGKEEENDYVEQVNEVNDSLATTLNDATSNLDPSNPQAAGDALDSAQSAISDSADELEAIDPPEEVADLHDQLVEGTRSVADQMAEFQDALASGNPQKLIQAATAFQTSVTTTLNEQSQIVTQINDELED